MSGSQREHIASQALGVLLPGICWWLLMSFLLGTATSRTGGRSPPVFDEGGWQVGRWEANPDEKRAKAGDQQRAPTSFASPHTE